MSNDPVSMMVVGYPVLVEAIEVAEKDCVVEVAEIRREKREGSKNWRKKE